MVKIKDILERKGGNVVSIFENQTVYEAIKFLVEHKIGAVLVRKENRELVGIISERDILRESYQNYGKQKETLVKDVMTTNLIVCEPEHDIEYAEQIMVQNRIRHLPVISGKRLVGIVSMRDIVQERLKGFKVENRYMRDYIEGKYPG